MVHLTRKEHFNAAHRLYVDAWSKEQNQEVFGKCANEHYHGHNFEVFVTVKGEPDPVTGFIMNAHELSQIMKREICEHVHFTAVLPDYNNYPATEAATCERTASVFYWSNRRTTTSHYADHKKITFL